MDDVPFAANLLGVPIAVDPGKHEFTTRAPGGPLIGQVIELEPGERRAVTLNVRSVSDNDSDLPPPSIEDPVEDDSGHSGWFYVAGGIGIVGAATGAVAGAILLDKRRTIMKECHDTDATPQIECTPKGKAAADSAQDVFAPVTQIALGVGAAGLAVAAVLWFTEGSSAPRDEARVRPTFRQIRNGGEFVLQGQF
jgi:hypothetical protein